MMAEIMFELVLVKLKLWLLDLMKEFCVNGTYVKVSMEPKCVNCFMLKNRDFGFKF